MPYLIILNAKETHIHSNCRMHSFFLVLPAMVIRSAVYRSRRGSTVNYNIHFYKYLTYILLDILK